MEDTLGTTVSVGQLYGRQKVANIVLEGARFWGRPNFAGEMDRFNEAKRQFTVKIPNEVADQLRDLGWNVKTTIPENEEDEPISSLKVKLSFTFDDNHPGDVEYERGPDITVIRGENREQLNSKTVGILDRSRFENIDMELRAWEYDPKNSPNQFSARLVELVAVLRPSRLKDKYDLR